MPEFLKLIPPFEALTLLMRSLPSPEPRGEWVETLHALGRITAEAIRAPHSLPAFPRSAMDGYAVRASETFGASESLPGYLALAGEVPMGAGPDFALQPGQAAIIHTGGMLPENADAVVALEQSEIARPGEIEILRAVAQGENVILEGEDVMQGQVIIPCGTRIRPAELGGCMALGITRVRVAVKPKIGILSSGDEVVPPEQAPGPGQVRDVNSYTLSALVSEAGGEPVLYGVVQDRLEAIQANLARALSECQVAVITAGSSASARDLTAEAIAAQGAPGVLVHGVNVRPGKPTILAVCDGRAVIGLPGNPVSALLIARLFVVPVIRNLLGVKMERSEAACLARLAVNVPSQAGREDWVPVKLILRSDQAAEGENWLAEPIFAKSNLIFSLAAADGLFCIPPDVTGLETGERVQVFLI
jgi:molybdopterin molybdotransferase